MREKLVRLAKEYGVVTLPLLTPFLARAQFPAPIVSQVSTLSGIQGFICTFIVGWMFTFLIILSVVFVLVAAFKYLTAGGDPEKVKGASHTLIYAAIAIVVAIMARAIPLLIGSLFQVSGFNC